MLKYLFPILLVSCTTLQPKQPIVKNQKRIILPTWTHETCKQTQNGVYVVGYGEGRNLASATRQALISSRGDALLCVFGGTYSTSTTIHDTNTQSSISAKTKVAYKYESVNWSGYKKSSTPLFFTKNDKNGIYVQYFWDIKSIDEERKRLDALNKQIETNRAMKEQVKVKDALIKEQKRTLNKMKKQEIEFKEIEKETRKALLKMNKYNNNKNKTNDNIQKIVDNLECGITPQELIKIYKNPDNIVKTTCSLKLKYGKFTLEVFNCKERNNLYNVAIDTINTNHDKKFYKNLCS